MPYRQLARASAVTIPGIAIAVYTENVEATVADLGAGSDQMKSHVPASCRSVTIVDTPISAAVITARAGAPVTM